MSEAHLPAEQPEAGQAARVPPPHVDAGGTSGVGRPSPQGSTAPVSLSRLHGRSSHAAVRRRGRRVRKGPLSVTVLLRDPASGSSAPPTAAIAWAIPRRVGSAVVRNRVRRRLRALVADEHRAAPLPAGAYVFHVDPLAADMTLRIVVGDAPRLADRGSPAGDRMSPTARVLRRSVLVYQAFRAGRPSPCRFVPSCSTYALEALETHGALRGSALAARRLCRCHPWGGHGFDPVPERKAV